MEKQELDSILLEDTEFYSKYNTYLTTLKKHNITTVGQLVKLNTYDINVYSNTRDELTLFMNMLKYRYLNRPLPYGNLLDRKIRIDVAKRGCYELSLPLENNDKDRPIIEISLMKFLGTRDRLLIYSFIEVMNEPEINDIINGNPRLIDYLRWISISGRTTKQSKSFANAYIEEYENDKINITENQKTLKILNAQLTELLEKREGINRSIEFVQKSVEKASSNKTYTK